MRFDQTGLKWINPSPNMRSLAEALLYPGIGLLETTNLSVGRGTDTPFEILGAPWIDGDRLAETLTAAGLPGIRFAPVDFTPTASKYRGQRCGGVRMTITDSSALEPVRVGLEIAHQLQRIYPQTWQARACDRLLCNAQVLEAILAGKPVAQIEAIDSAGLEEFLQRRTSYLLYED